MYHRWVRDETTIDRVLFDAEVFDEATFDGAAYDEGQAMILADIRDYLKQRRQCTLSDIALHFDSDADAVRGMLDVWIRKGKVEKRSATASCGTSCQSCDPAATELYFWVEPASPPEIKLSVPLPGHCNHK